MTSITRFLRVYWWVSSTNCPPPGLLALSHLFTTLSFIYCPLTFIYCPLAFLPIGSRHRTDYKVRFYLPNTRSKSALHKETSFGHNSNMICYFTSLFLTQKIATCNKGCSRNYPWGGPQTLFCPVGGGCLVDNVSEGWGGNLSWGSRCIWSIVGQVN